jgi:hypothetical protein
MVCNYRAPEGAGRQREISLRDLPGLYHPAPGTPPPYLP